MSACGFQLRGVSKLPDYLSPMRLVTYNFETDQLSQLRFHLERAGAKLTNRSTDRAVKLVLSMTILPVRNIADSAGTGSSIYRFSRQLEYSLSDADGGVLVEQIIITRQQDFEQDNKNVLATESEKQSLGNLLDRELFNQLISQLTRL